MAQKHWQRLRGYNLLADVITDVKYSDAINKEPQDHGAV